MVVCVNCKHCREYVSAIVPPWCMHESLEVLGEMDFVYGQRRPSRHPRCEDINKNGQCKLYEAKPSQPPETTP